MVKKLNTRTIRPGSELPRNTPTVVSCGEPIDPDRDHHLHDERDDDRHGDHPVPPPRKHDVTLSRASAASAIRAGVADFDIRARPGHDGGCGRPPMSEQSRGHRVVLIVDDDAGVRTVVAWQLEAAGYTVTQAGDGVPKPSARSPTAGPTSSCSTCRCPASPASTCCARSATGRRPPRRTCR